MIICLPKCDLEIIHDALITQNICWPNYYHGGMSSSALYRFPDESSVLIIQTNFFKVLTIKFFRPSGELALMCSQLGE